MKRVAAVIVGFVSVTLSSASVLRAAVLLVGDGTPSSCTQLALETALATAGGGGGDIIRFRCGEAPVTITIAAALTVPTKTTIDGGGLVSLEGPVGEPLVTVPVHTSVIFENLAIRNSVSVAVVVEGTLTVTHSTLSDHRNGDIFNLGTLIVKDSTFAGTGFHAAAAIENFGTFTVQGSGFFNNNEGAIFNDGTGEVVSCVFSGNLSHGGTIINSQGSLTVRDSVFSHNSSNGGGGAIANGATLDVSDSTFFANEALIAGGAIANGGVLTLRNSQLIDNRGADFGGGVYNQSSQDALIDRTFLVGNTAASGGGIAQVGAGTVIVNNSFILANKATDNGGGIYILDGSPAPTLKRTTVTNNTPNDIFFQP